MYSVWNRYGEPACRSFCERYESGSILTGQCKLAGQPDFTGLVAGNYSVYIVDALGCRNFTDITIGQPAALQATASPQAVRRHGANDGQVLVSASGGTPAYQYLA